MQEWRAGLHREAKPPGGRSIGRSEIVSVMQMQIAL